MEAMEAVNSLVIGTSNNVILPIKSKGSILVSDSSFNYYGARYYDSGMIISVFIAAVNRDNFTQITVRDLMDSCDITFLSSIVGVEPIDKDDKSNNPHELHREQLFNMSKLLNIRIEILNSELKMFDSMGSSMTNILNPIKLVYANGLYSAYVELNQKPELFADILRYHFCKTNTSYSNIMIGDQKLYSCNGYGNCDNFGEFYQQMIKLNTDHREALQKADNDYKSSREGLLNLVELKRKKLQDDFDYKIKMAVHDNAINDNRTISDAMGYPGRGCDLIYVKCLIDKKIKLTHDQAKKLCRLLLDKGEFDLITEIAKLAS